MVSMKGQYFSFDAIIASVIFLLAIFMLFGYWHSVKTFLEYQSGQVSREAMRVSSVLFMPGFPQGADCTRMTTFGLATSWEDKRIRESTLWCVKSAVDADSTWFQQKLGSPYNITIKVIYDNKEMMIGGEPSGSEIVKIRRAGTVVVEDRAADSIGIFDIYLYR